MNLSQLPIKSSRCANASVALLMCSIVIGAPMVDAQETRTERPAAPAYSPWIAGVGYIRGANPFVAEPNGVSAVIPLVGYLGERLTWFGPYLNYKVMDERDGWTVNLTSSLRFQGFDYDGDDPRLVGLADRDAALDIGGSIERGDFELSVMADASGTYDGYEVGLSYKKGFSPKRFARITLSANVAWQSENLVDYYYGVSATEATATRPAYVGSAGTNFGVGADLNMFLSRHWALMARTSVTALADEIVDSPIVEDDYEFSALVGVIYRFGASK